MFIINSAQRFMNIDFLKRSKTRDGQVTLDSVGQAGLGSPRLAGQGKIIYL